MRRSPEPFLRARLIALYLLSLAAVMSSQLAWLGERAFSPVTLAWPPLGLGAAALGGALLHERQSGLLDRHARSRVRAAAGLAYGTVLLVVGFGLLIGSPDAAQGGCALLRCLQPAFLLLAGFGRGHLGTLINALALASTSVLAGGPGAAVSATLEGGLLVFFLAADRPARVLSQFPIDEMPATGPILGRGALASAAIGFLLAAFFWLVPAAPYAPLQKAGAIASLPADRLVGLISNLALVAILSALAFYLLLRLGGGGRGLSTEEPVTVVVAARRETGRPEGARYREPGVPARQWRARIVALYVKTSEQLAKWGMRRRPSETPREFARGLAPAASAAELADLFGQARYGPEDLGEADFDRAGRVCQEILDHHRRRS